MEINSNLSKYISYLLRHSSLDNNINISDDGWVSLDDLLQFLKKKEEFVYVEKDDIFKLVAFANKKRHEIKDDKIRALYGHSIVVEKKYKITEPPVYLYHGTTNNNLKKILNEGLKPMGRMYVHLTKDVETAYNVAIRKTKNPIIIKIKSLEASKNGRFFFLEGEVFLSEYISPEYLEITY